MSLRDKWDAQVAGWREEPVLLVLLVLRARLEP